MATVVCIFAHPDDEAFGPGGTIAKLSRDHDVHIICCTDGDHRGNGIKNIRAEELNSSAKILGAKDVIFLDFVDGSLSNNLYHQLADRLKSLLETLRPQTIITFEPLGVSGHIDHITITSVVNYLFDRLSYIRKIMYYTLSREAREMIQDYFVYMPPGHSKAEVDQIINVADVWETRLSAVRAHKSQPQDQKMVLDILSRLPREEYFFVRTR